MKPLIPFEVISSGCNALVVPFQQFWNPPWKFSCVRMSLTFVHRPSFIFSIVLIMTACELRESAKGHRGARSGTIGRMKNCLDVQLGQIVLWQGWSCGTWCIVPGGNATDPIWKILASSLGISSCHSKNWCSIHARWSKSSPEAFHTLLWHFFPCFKNTILLHIVLLKWSWTSRLHFWNSPAMTIRPLVGCSCFIWSWKSSNLVSPSHKMYSNNILNFQESMTILNACIKCLETYWRAPRKKLAIYWKYPKGFYKKNSLL